MNYGAQFRHLIAKFVLAELDKLGDDCRGLGRQIPFGRLALMGAD
jgi:hypothetical protein